MSYKVLIDAIQGLPRALKDQVLGYALCVEGALPEIFKKAGRQYDNAIGDQIIFLAGMRKLYSLVSSNYWTLDNSATLLGDMDVKHITAGSVDLSKSGKLHANLQELNKSLEDIFSEHELLQYFNVDYAEIVNNLISNGHK